ncbi:hypothetical protein [Paraburkholderia phytofirmans]|uniref:SH3 domain-containing protein n=1 Tax=Paraburkholderia phytofirmans TaxID=261302 RepID=A0ABW9BFX5_9BURK
MILNKKILLYSLMVFCNLCHAADVVIFDSPNLIAVTSENSLRGYYGALEKGASCMFFFTADLKNSKKTSDGLYSTFDVATYALNSEQFLYAKRDVRFDTPGKLYVMGDQWIIKTDAEPPGCGGAVGFFHLGPYDHDATRYYVSRKIPALGLDIVTRKTFFHDKRGRSFLKRKTYLTAGDVVAVLKQDGVYFFVRYTDPDYFNPVPGKVTAGWVRSTDLNDPFPSMAKR